MTEPHVTFGVGAGVEHLRHEVAVFENGDCGMPSQSTLTGVPSAVMSLDRPDACCPMVIVWGVTMSAVNVVLDVGSCVQLDAVEVRLTVGIGVQP